MHRFASSILAAALALLAGCAKPDTPPAAVATALPLAKVRVATVRAENLPTLTEVTGTVRPVQRAQLAAKLMGTIEELPVTLGQRVRTGDLLVKISAGEVAARLVQAQAQHNATRRDLERERGLIAKGASTADTVKSLEDRLAGAQALVREAEVMQSYTAIRAPFDGVIARRLAYAGDLASPGAPLLELEGTTQFEIEAPIPDTLAARLAAGASLAIELPATGATFTGKIAELSSAADAGARSVLAKIAVPSDRPVRSGEFARVLVPGAPVRTLLAPATAVSMLGQMERVFVVGAPNRAELRLVKTGAPRGDRIEIQSGLDDGELIVAAPPATLREGQPLEIQP